MTCLCYAALLAIRASTGRAAVSREKLQASREELQLLRPPSPIVCSALRQQTLLTCSIVQELMDRGANPMGSKWELGQVLREMLEREREEAMEQLSPLCAPLPVQLSTLQAAMTWTRATFMQAAALQ